MITPIRGKVARVLNAREIAINIGTANDVTVGMYFDVIDPNEGDIKDPDTGEVLGSIERPKVRVQVTHVQEKLSVAATDRSKRVNLGGSGHFELPGLALGPFARALMPPKWITKYETLKKTGETVSELDEKDSSVKTGDLVVQVIEETNTEGKVPTENTEALNPSAEEL